MTNKYPIIYRARLKNRRVIVVRHSNKDVHLVFRKLSTPEEIKENYMKGATWDFDPKTKTYVSQIGATRIKIRKNIVVTMTAISGEVMNSILSCWNEIKRRI